MRWFGRTKPEQLRSLTTEIEKIERQIALRHVEEMIELLELACEARDSVCCGPGDDMILYRVQGKIRNFLRDLDQETHRVLLAATLKKKEESE